MSTSATGGTMTRLREATAEAHARLERASGLPATIRGRGDLVAVLERLFGFHASAEALGVDASLVGDLGDERASRAAWLAEDLRRLGHDDASLAALPRCVGLGPFDGVAARLGCAYVVEGSALGGRLIQRHLERLGHALELPAGLEPGGLRFFAGHGHATAGRWRAFGRAVETHPIVRAREGELIEAARATFETLIAWFGDGRRSGCSAGAAGHRSAVRAR